METSKKLEMIVANVSRGYLATKSILNQVSIAKLSKKEIDKNRDPKQKYINTIARRNKIKTTVKKIKHMPPEKIDEDQYNIPE